MPKYSVELPISGRALLEVEAPNAEAAITEAMGQCSIEHIEEWDPKRKLVEGNVCYASITRASATEITDDE